MAQDEDPRRLAAAREKPLDDPEFLRSIVETTVQRLLECEMTEHLQAGLYERTEARKGHRNDAKPRTLKTRVGTVELHVPQDRKGTFNTEVIEAPCGTGFSKATVGRWAGELDGDLVTWRDRRLDEVADARYEHLRIGRQAVSQRVLIVISVREDGHRELLAVDVADTESDATYDQHFRSPKKRGLNGARLVTSDDHRDLVAAIERHVQAAAWQRCHVHVLRNAGGKVARNTGRPSRTI